MSSLLSCLSVNNEPNLSLIQLPLFVQLVLTGYTISPDIATDETQSGSDKQAPQAQDAMAIVNSNKSENGSEKPAFFDGPLGQLMPNLALLPDNLNESDSGSLTESIRAKDRRNKLLAQSILTKGDYRGIWQSYSSGFLCEGEIGKALFWIDWFNEPTLAHEFFQLAIEDNRNNPSTIRFHSDNHEFGERLVMDSTESCNGSKNLNWRSLQIGNVILSVGLYSKLGTAGDNAISELSETLMATMSDGIINVKQ